MLVALSRAVETRHPWMRGHGNRVTELALAVARSLGWEQRRLDAIRLGSLLHDVGKLSLSRELLGKPGPLTATELEEVRRHPTSGARLVGTLARAHPALPCVRFHHERWDGCGYPHAMPGSAIPVEARLVSLADAFDAMTSLRPYSAALAVDTALNEVSRCAGTQFDPALAHACVEVWATQARFAV
jgi:HD-GYP domain-containing protein (c-di-GMP phosphodiesterase class II)